MTRLVCLLILLSLCGCTPSIDLKKMYMEQAISASWPNLGFSYGDLSWSFTAGQVSVRIGQVSDSGIRSFLITGANGAGSIRMEVMTDSLRAGTYNLDGTSGTVAVYDNHNNQIGFLGAGYFQLQISYGPNRNLTGNFSGTLSDPGTGSVGAISGYFINL